MSLSYRPDLADSWYSLSYLYLAVFGMLITIVSGLLVSIATGESLSIAPKCLLLWVMCAIKCISDSALFFLGGCKQEKLSSDLFVRKSDLICFRWCRKSEVRDGACCRTWCHSENKSNQECLSEWSPQASDVREKDSPEFRGGTDNPAFTDIVMSKDAEAVTHF